MRVLEITAFIALSSALHAATVILAPVQVGGDGGGDGGQAEVSVQAASPTLAAMVQEWDRPPEVSDAPVLTAPGASPPPERPAQDVPPTTRQTHGALPPPGPAPDLPQAETRLPAPPVPFARDAPAVLTMPEPGTAVGADLSGTEAPMRPPTPVQPTMSETATLPQVDTAPPASRTAPHASLRPEQRPERSERPVPRAQPQAPSQAPSQARKTANGAGTGPAARNQAPSPAPRGPSKAELVRLEQHWGAQITAALRRAHRPPRGVQGTVHLMIAVTPAGKVTSVSLAASSGNTRLDQAALTAVRRARFPRAPEGLTNTSYRFSQRLTVAR